jgi:hypothetical protein
VTAFHTLVADFVLFGPSTAKENLPASYFDGLKGGEKGIDALLAV